MNLDLGVPRVTIVDMMGRSKDVPAPGGRLRLTLSPQMQYVLLPRNSAAALKIANAELRRRLEVAAGECRRSAGKNRRGREDRRR